MCPYGGLPAAGPGTGRLHRGASGSSILKVGPVTELRWWLPRRASTVPARLSSTCACSGVSSVTAGDRSTDHWPRPSARRLCQLVLISSGRRVSRERPRKPCSHRSVSRLRPAHYTRPSRWPVWLSTSSVRHARSLLCADRCQIWAAAGVDLQVDLDDHEQALREALTAPPGLGRDRSLVAALVDARYPARRRA